ncbi:MAG: response regulator transcription factor [Fulvivirga sp.]|uniref:response regulator transcription factor n=1 Tax=Fulvivirga sp. TaxID=1931237 RepID=UPI0032ED924D
MSEEKTLNIVIIDKDTQFIDVSTFVINYSKKYNVVNSYVHTEHALRAIDKDKPDIILIDLELIGFDGLQSIEKIKKRNNAIEIVVNTRDYTSNQVIQALSAGASGYIMKDKGYTKLIEALDEVTNGGAPLSRTIARIVVESFHRNRNSPLTLRETQVLELLALGMNYSKIAEELIINPETSKTHIKNIYSKLHVNSKSEALAVAKAKKLI